MSDWRSRKALVTIALFGVWAGGWGWAFSYGYSNSFFSYDLCSRLPVFAASLFAACAIPLVALMQWRSRRPFISACLRYLLFAMASLAPLAAALVLLSQASFPCRISGDDAMGAGIDFAILTGIATLSLAALAGALITRAFRSRQKT